MDDFSQRLELIYKKYFDWGEANGFKPSKLAFSRFLGVTQGAMQKWEKGTIPSAKFIKIIHDKLGFSYDWLIAGEGEMFDASAQIIANQKNEISRLQTQIRVEGASDQGARTDTGLAGEG